MKAISLKPCDLPGLTNQEDTNGSGDPKTVHWSRGSFTGKLSGTHQTSSASVVCTGTCLLQPAPELMFQRLRSRSPQGHAYPPPQTSPPLKTTLWFPRQRMERWWGEAKCMF